MNAALMIILLVGIASVSALPRSFQQPPAPIIGGDTAVRGEFPWIVDIVFTGSHMCGGSIVNANYIVTAARCAIYPSVYDYKIVAGEHNRNTNEGSEQSRNVSSITKHPKYNFITFENDIAVMKLSEPLTFDTYVKAATLAPADFNPASNLVAAGWGATTFENSAETLMKVTVPFVSDAACKAAYGESEIQPGMLCAGTEGKDHCDRDNGGPLHSGTTLVGLISWGFGCATAAYPGVYSSVSYFNSWIEANTQ